MSTVIACEDSTISLPNIRLEDAYRHVFGHNGHEPCPWCSRTFKTKRDLQEQYYEVAPGLPF
jgi:hypothetical protein